MFSRPSSFVRDFFYFKTIHFQPRTFYRTLWIWLIDQRNIFELRKVEIIVRVEVKVARIELMGKLQIKWPPSGNGPRDPDSKLPPITKRHSLAQLLPVEHQDIRSPIDSNFTRVTGIFLYLSCIRVAYVFHMSFGRYFISKWVAKGVACGWYKVCNIFCREVFDKIVSNRQRDICSPH